jgi:hypothetical protein
MNQKDGAASLQTASPLLYSSKGNLEEGVQLQSSGKVIQSTLEGCSGVKNWKTPEMTQVQNSDCNIVGNKFLSLINEESQHSKWEEFRRMARQETDTDECSTLLRRMELEALEDDENISENEIMEDAEELACLQDLEIPDEAIIVEEQLMAKNQKRKPKWGPTLRVPRPRRHPEDGRTVMEKAQDLKKAKNLETGTKYKSSFAFESTKNLLKKANSVNISLGTNTCLEIEKIESLKLKELNDRANFEENNPEVNLPVNLDITLSRDDFLPLNNVSAVPLKEQNELGDQSWVEIASKSCEKSKQKLSNVRSLMEC